MKLFERLLKTSTESHSDEDYIPNNYPSDEDYVPNDYPRSKVRYTHERLDPFLRARGLKLSFEMDRLLFTNAIVAGSYVADLVAGYHGSMANDIDLFFRSERAFKTTVDLLLEAGFRPDEADSYLINPHTNRLDTARPGFVDKAFIQLEAPLGRLHTGHRFQCVKIRYFDDAEHVIDCFDFTCIQFALDMSKDKLVYNPAGAIDLGARRLVQHRIESHSRVLKRLEKYCGKGFLSAPGFVVPLPTEDSP